RHWHAVVALEPAHCLERLRKTLFLDVDDLVVEPGRPFVVLDRQRAEWDRFANVWVIDRAARLAVHALDLAVLGLVVRNDAIEILGREFLAGLVLDDGSKHVEKLSLVE